VLRPPIAIAVSLAVVAALLTVPALPASAAPTELDGPSPVLIWEVANGGARSESDTFIELRNVSDAPVDLGDWAVFRCTEHGTRVNTGRPEVDLSGVVLAAGDTFTISKIGMPGDAHVSDPLPSAGFGVVLVAPGDRIADRLGVYPNAPWMMRSECSGDENLPNRLDHARDESWQRVAVTGDPSTDFIAAPATPDAPNATEPTPRADRGVVVAEVASTGPDSDADEFVELLNRGDTTEDLGGWTVSRCTATGQMGDGTVLVTLPPGTVLEPGGRLLVAGPGYSGAAPADAVTAASIADLAFGIAVADGGGLLVDRVAVARHADSACQDGDEKLSPIADAVAGESYQRVGDDWIVAPRTPGASNAVTAAAVAEQAFAYPSPTGVAISEVATDPAQAELPDGMVQRNWIELANYGERDVDISGWEVRRCQADGTRARAPQAVVPDGTVLAPGETWLVAREGTAAAADADATYAVALNLLGAGVWVADAAGRRVDSMGAFALNEMDVAEVVLSPCTKGASLPAFLPDRVAGETFRRATFTGVDAEDFVAGRATPGELDLVDRADPTARVVTVEPAAAGIARRSLAEARGPVRANAPAAILGAWSGAVDGAGQPGGPGPQTSEAPVADIATALAGTGYERPYLRIAIDAIGLGPGSMVAWSGRTLARAEVQLSVWSATAGGWRRLDAGTGDPVTLGGALEAGDIADGRVVLLVQDGDRVDSTLAAAPDGAFEDPADYDLAIAHVTDTQYLTEAYPAVYAQMVSWIADEASARKIRFVQHTGDLVQNWVDPDQSPDRAEIEFARASRIQSILDDAGIPNAVLPGNHDSKRGLDYSRFNAVFGPDRYAGTSWYGGSFADGDNRASWSLVEEGGVRFVILDLPYGYGDAELAWAERVVSEHQDANVVIATHEHLRPETTDEPARRSDASRWNSRADELWERVIAPNRNVVLVLSGHFHGLGQIVTEDAGGLPGHTVVELLADYQEYRTHTGQRATGFFRLLQVDVDGGAIAVDTRSVRLAESSGAAYDYLQVHQENGMPTAQTNNRPWNVVAAGLQGRYDALDDEFRIAVELQHDTLVATTAVTVGP